MVAEDARIVLPAGWAAVRHGIFIRIIIDGKREIREINADYMETYHQGKTIR